MSTRIELLRELDELVEAARLLGATQAKRLFGCHTDEDRRFERAMYESIDKHRAALLAEREDAARYRWLRDPCSGAERVIFYCRGDYGRGLMSGSMLDAAIDDAMRKEGRGND